MDGDVIRCNHCMSVFAEDDIQLRDGEEVCPRCGETGALMDMSV